jgi:hypothetical protein
VHAPDGARAEVLHLDLEHHARRMPSRPCWWSAPGCWTHTARHWYLLHTTSMFKHKHPGYMSLHNKRKHKCMYSMSGDLFLYIKI